MAPWLVMILKNIVAPFLVEKAIDYAKEELHDKEVDDAIEKVSQVAQKLSIVKEADKEGSPKGHIDDETKAKALLVVQGAMDIVEMLDEEGIF